MPSGKLSDLIGSLDYVQAFQKSEAALHADKAVWTDYARMKELQKKAVLFNKLGKTQAFRETAQAAQILEKGLKLNPLVEDYSAKMQDVNDLLQYVTGEIERKVNERL